MTTAHAHELKVAVLVDCDNTTPEILEYALKMVAQFGRVVLRRGYGNQNTLNKTWQEALVNQAFTPCLQFQYVSGKNTADIALALDALEAMFDGRAEKFCLVTSDSDFAYLCRKLRERGASVCIVGEAKTPSALRNASDQFFEWVPQPQTIETIQVPVGAKVVGAKKLPAKAIVKKDLPRFIVEAVTLLVGSTSDGATNLAALGHYLKRTDPGFTPAAYGFSGLLAMLKAYKELVLVKVNGGHTVSLKAV